jgi:hypothetical protein
MSLKLKKITLTFPEPLTKIIHYQEQDVTQEDILFADLDGIREKLRCELRKVTRGIDIVRRLGIDFFDVVTLRIEGMQVKMDSMLAWSRDETNPCVYTIYYPLDSEALLQLRGVGANLPFIGKHLKDKDINIARVIREKQFIESIQKFSMKEMHIDPATVQIDVKEVEGVSDETPKVVP